MTGTSYRLPDWLGGHPVYANAFDVAEEHSQVRIRIEGAPDSTECEFPRHWLVEVRPPSIEDPAPWPLEISDGSGRWVRLYDLESIETTLRVGYRDRDWGYDMTPADLRLLARAAWQRANAVEATS